jgi:8-oxo-dGTP diphosphatase
MHGITTTIDKPLVMENTPKGSAILRAAVSIDCVILRFDEGQLSILLNKESDVSLWSLPSRLMQSDENASDAAAKLVHQFTSANKPYMEQVYTFTDVTSDQPHPTISITYVALIKGANDSKDQRSYQWFSTSELPSLVQAHQEKISGALTVIKRKATYDPLYFDLLPERFTLPQLRRLFEEIYGERFDQRNFNKKFKALGLLIKLNEKETTQSKKGAFYYMFDRAKYYKMERPALKFAHLLY